MVPLRLYSHLAFSVYPSLLSPTNNTFKDPNVCSIYILCLKCMHPSRFISNITFLKKISKFLQEEWFRFCCIVGIDYALVTNNSEISVAHHKKVLFIIMPHVHHGTPGFSMPCHDSSHSTTHFLEQRLANLWAKSYCYLYLYWQWAKNVFKTLSS